MRHASHSRAISSAFCCLTGRLSRRPLYQTGTDRKGIAMKALLGLAALCVVCLLLGASLARAGSFSATATAGPPTTGTQCGFGDTSAGGSGFTSASIGPISCVYVNPFFGGSISSEVSASGSWATGDFSASAVVAANPGFGGHGNSIGATGAVTFYDAGLVTLPAGMDFGPDHVWRDRPVRSRGWRSLRSPCRGRWVLIWRHNYAEYACRRVHGH